MQPSHRTAQGMVLPTRLHDRRLLLIWILWAAIASFALLVYATSLPAYSARLHTLCTNGVCVPGQLSPARAQMLQHMGISLSLYAALAIGLNIVTSLLWLAIAMVLFLRKSHDWMALLVALTLVLVSATVPPDQSAPLWQWPLRCVDFLAVVLLFLVFSLFPNGRFVPGWMRWLPVVYGAMNALDFFPNLLFDLPGWLNLLYLFLLFGCIGMLGVAQVYRYKHMSTAIERQQIKWVVFSCAAVISGEFMLWLVTLIFPSLWQVGSLYDLYFNPASILLILLIPLSLGIAILRYRLWNIDVLINRTLVYGILTASLAGVYVSLVIALQFLLRGLFSQTNDVALVASTLAVAALFQPLRRRIQHGIDRRFYRSKYDATHTLADFSARLRLREDIDLTSLTHDLLAIVEKTMQPAHVSLWLRPRQWDVKQITRLLPGLGEEER